MSHFTWLVAFDSLHNLTKHRNLDVVSQLGKYIYMRQCTHADLLFVNITGPSAVQVYINASRVSKMEGKLLLSLTESCVDDAFYIFKPETFGISKHLQVLTLILD